MPGLVPNGQIMLAAMIACGVNLSGSREILAEVPIFNEEVKALASVDRLRDLMAQSAN